MHVVTLGEVRAMVRMVDPKVLKQYLLARLIPDMRDSEWKDFCAGIAVRAVKVPLEVSHDGTVLDGRHRVRRPCRRKGTGSRAHRPT